MTQDKDQMRAEFEAIFSKPPYEFDMRRRPNDQRLTAWPDSYVKYEVACAWDGFREARASAPQGVPEGRRLVPVEATPEMLNASRWSGSGNVSVDEEWARKQVWHRMLAAAPQPDVQDVSDIEAMVAMLESKEWADHVGTSELGKRFEHCISELHNALHGAKQDAERWKFFMDLLDGIGDEDDPAAKGFPESIHSAFMCGSAATIAAINAAMTAQKGQA